ncbi:Biotin carboxyl carrier protein of acetyl-CoA carboxylase [Pannonibacter phragmitetus]|jgi:biotin carboxyl carrier protein|uniref:Biotin carboxyl carrier protein of acetyl-CoA carboxylase n=2 Tax=Pannonibacter phragmitetus TaxID=121719 RepID=A0A378ZSB9_9HYPH|nr:acetyl-CoA carboxylase [Pannonibacter phragmitetus]SUA99680.1 Biotin carboxyl carrier protein of acetyl-CoA carboxylase [Pannonibacter phragmitetus]
MSKIEIRSPLPGIFYRKPSPDAAAFTQDGASVGEADVIGLIEVMKTFHEIPAGLSGSNITFHVEDAEPVMAGQVLAEVDA